MEVTREGCVLVPCVDFKKYVARPSCLFFLMSPVEFKMAMPLVSITITSMCCLTY